MQPIKIILNYGTEIYTQTFIFFLVFIFSIHTLAFSVCRQKKKQNNYQQFIGNFVVVDFDRSVDRLLIISNHEFICYWLKYKNDVIMIEFIRAKPEKKNDTQTMENHHYSGKFFQMN